MDELERELNLPRCPGRFGDLTEAGPVEDVCRQAHVDDVQEIEELGPELEIHTLGSAAAMGNGRALDESEVVVITKQCVLDDIGEQHLVTLAICEQGVRTQSSQLFTDDDCVWCRLSQTRVFVGL